MRIHYDSRTDLLYIRLDETEQPVVNKRLDEDIVLDMGESDRIVGIEIMDASQRVNLSAVLPITFGAPSAAA